MSEMLPNNWIIENIVKIINSVPTGVPEFKDEKEYYSTGSIKENGNTSEGRFTYKTKPSRANRISAINDVFQARMKETDKGLIIDNELVGELFSTGFMQFRPYGNTYIHKLLFYYIKSPDFLNQRDDLTTGSTQEALTDTKAVELTIPLPPLNEQKRIVAKLDAIMPRIEAVKTRLDKVPGILKRFRQSVLTAAVTGRLTEQWREEHPEVESAEKVIDKLLISRLQKCSTPVQKQRIEEIYTEIESEDDSSLPDTWKYSFLNKVCDSFQYGTSAKSDKEGKVVVLRMGNLQNGIIDWADLAYTSDDKEIEKYLLKKDDVLFNRTNSPELVGKTSIYTGEKKAIFAGYLIRINNYRHVLDSRYLNYALNTGYAKEFCHREKTDGVSQSNINAQKLAHFEIPLPPLEEQKEIVRQVDKLFALADKVEAHYQKAKARVDKLSQSVLAKAFRGELVPQDPNDEPAEKLLERILEEKERLSQSTQRTRRKKI